MATASVPRRTFTSKPESIAQVRRFVEAAVDGHPCKDDTVLVVDELATNAYRHTPAAEFTVTVYCDPCGVIVTVGADAGGEGQPRAYGDGVFGRDGDETGRGLFIVKALSKEWGVGSVNGGQVVYAKLITPVEALVLVAK